MQRTFLTEDELKQTGEKIAAVLRGGECFELVGDVGVGKTTFTKGLGQGLAVDEDVQSPSFTISRIYEARDGLSLQHFDFYRLSEPGVMSYELAEALDDPKAVTIVEWGETVTDVLPESRIRLTLSYQREGEGRDGVFVVPKDLSYITEVLV